MATEPRKRGAQPGNQNARQRSFDHLLNLTDKELQLLDEATGLRDTDVIDLLRFELLRLISLRDFDHRALAALAKAIATAQLTQHKITGGDDRKDMFAALDAVLADVRRAQEEPSAATR